MTTRHILTAGLSLLAASFAVFAAGPARAEAPLEAPRPASPPAPTADARPKEVTPKAQVAAPTGIVFSAGSAIEYAGGDLFKGVAMNGVAIAGQLRLGYFPTRHVGVILGAEAGTGMLIDGCSGACTSLAFVRAPMVVELALTSRSRGLYFDVGASPFNYNVASGDAKDQNSKSLTFRSPLDLVGAVGYRISDEEGKSAIAVQLASTVGRFDKVEVSGGGGRAGGVLDGSDQGIHFTTALSAVYHFNP